MRVSLVHWAATVEASAGARAISIEHVVRDEEGGAAYFFGDDRSLLEAPDGARMGFGAVGRVDSSWCA